jgi:ribosomal protein S12 methylthiotransferase accessory factor
MLELLDTPPTPVGDALVRLEQAVSPLVGIVRTAPTIMVAADEPCLHAFACQVASATRTTGAATVEYAGSAHVDARRARAASIGEAVERYSATFVPEGLTLSTAAELGSHAVPPESFALFHERQHVLGFPFARFTPSTRLSFVEGFSLADGRPAFLPAQLVYLHRSAVEPPIGYSTSNGLACGPTLAEAVLAALLEVVERDAMMLVWANRLSLPRLTWRDDPTIRDLDERVFAPTGLRYTAIDTSVFFGVPAAVGVVHGAASDRAALGLGGGCAPTVGDAWRTCLGEAFAVHRWLRGLLAEAPEPIERSEDVRSLEDHTLFHGTRERAGMLSFLEASAEERSTTGVPAIPGVTPGAVVSEIVGRLGDRGVSAYAVDVTSPDVEELGVKVARVVTPQLCALDVLGAAPYRGGERLYRAAFDAGLVDTPLAYDELNPFPHPYP